MTRSMRLALAVAASVAFARAAAAQPTVNPDWLWFPGEMRHPSSAASAGRALADRWLAEAPFDNPAVAPRRGIEVTPVLVRGSRPDLRAQNRNYDETPAFLDVGGAAVVYGMSGLALFAYADQPVLRLESSAFTIGRTEPVGPAPPPANVTLDLAARQVRAGAGLSWGVGALRIGAAGEWTTRRERDEVTVQSGAPTGNGTALTDLEGNGVGAQAGARLTLPLRGPEGVVIGAAARWNPELSITGDTLAITRASGWEGGLSARVSVAESFRLYGAWGGAAAREWEGLGVRTGASTEWSIAVELHQPETPWTASLGVGQERQDDVLDARAGRVGLGFGWNFGGTTLTIAALRRNLERTGEPDSYDDRVLATLGVSF